MSSLCYTTLVSTFYPKSYLIQSTIFQGGKKIRSKQNESEYSGGTMKDVIAVHINHSKKIWDPGMQHVLLGGDLQESCLPGSTIWLPLWLTPVPQNLMAFLTAIFEKLARKDTVVVPHYLIVDSPHTSRRPPRTLPGRTLWLTPKIRRRPSTFFSSESAYS